MKTLGLVLCGGKSSRMGTDKGLIKKENVTWSEIAFRKLSQLSVPVVLSVNSNQLTSYGKIFSEEILLKDQLEIGGPLNGIISAHLAFPNNDIFVLACDMLKLEIGPLRRLYDVYISQQDNYEYFVYRNKESYEPLCGIYTSRALSKVSKDIKIGVLKKFSMKYILEMGNTFSLTINPADEDQFLNFNEPYNTMS